MTVTLTTFRSNTAEFGGGIHNVEAGRVAVDGSTFSENRTTYYGAGIFNGATLTVTNSTFQGNLGDAGGGIYNDVTAWVESSTFYANTVTGVGGGIINNHGSLSLADSTLAGNSASDGGGLGNVATLNYRNTIIADNLSGGDCRNWDTISENLNNLVEDGGCEAAFSGDPALQVLADNGGPAWTCSLQADSLAIDMGDSSACPALDQRGQARDDWNCDIGSFELKLADSSIVTKSIDGAGEYTFGPTRVKVELTESGELYELAVTQVTGDHAGSTGSPGGNGVGWGEYFVLNPNDEANGTFNATLTLPSLYPPDEFDSVCRYIGEYTWDCAADSFATTPFYTISRADVSEFSDWAAGDDVSPTAIRLTTLLATTRTADGIFILLGVVLATSACGLAAIILHRKMRVRQLSDRE
jgi:hypothetical protein